MLSTIRYYLYYGFFGTQIVDTIIAGGKSAKIAIVVWLALSAAGYIIIRNRLDKKAGCRTALVTLAVYVLLVGLFSIIAGGMLGFFIWLFTSGIRDDGTPSKPKTPEQLEKDRKDALYYEIANSDELLRCLDRQEQARYIAEAQSLVYDNNVTPQQIESRLSHWEYYRSNPMPGSDRYRELYGDD